MTITTTAKAPIDDTAWRDSQLAAKYLEGVRGAVPFAEEQFDVMRRLIAASGIPVRTFLDIGCGAGAVGSAVLARWPEARGVFVDFSPKMIEEACKNLAHMGGRARIVELDYGEACWIEQVRADAPYSAIVSGYSIHHQMHERKHEIYREIFDLLAPGAFFVNIEHVASATPWLSERFDERFIDALHVFESARGGGRTREQIADEYYHRDDKQANILAPVEQQCEWLRAIGFGDVDCYFKHFELGVFGGRKPAAD